MAHTLLHLYVSLFPVWSLGRFMAILRVLVELNPLHLLVVDFLFRDNVSGFNSSDVPIL